MSKTRQRKHALLIVLFVIYLVELAWTVIWKLDVPYIGAAALLPRPFKLVPFVASGHAGASAPLEVVANVLLFVPFGVFLGLIARWRWCPTAAVFAGASAVLEITQHVMSVGSFDITDVIVNTAGGVLGLGVLALLRRRLGARTEAVTTRALVAWTVLSVLAIAAFVASPLHYEQTKDVIFPSPMSTA